MIQGDGGAEAAEPAAVHACTATTDADHYRSSAYKKCMSTGLEPLTARFEVLVLGEELLGLLSCAPSLVRFAFSALSHSRNRLNSRNVPSEPP